MNCGKKFVIIFCYFLVVLMGCSRSAQDDVKKSPFTMASCKNIFGLHDRYEDGFIVSKYIPKGPAVTDNTVFSTGSCIVINLKNKEQKDIMTPVGKLINKDIYFINQNKVPELITAYFKIPHQNAAGIVYWVSEQFNKEYEPKKTGFDLFNWTGEPFKYKRVEGTLIINPTEAEDKGPGSSGRLIGFKDWQHTMGF
jgi:hypothetical protein